MADKAPVIPIKAPSPQEGQQEEEVPEDARKPQQSWWARLNTPLGHTISIAGVVIAMFALLATCVDSEFQGVRNEIRASEHRVQESITQSESRMDARITRSESRTNARIEKSEERLSARMKETQTQIDEVRHTLHDLRGDVGYIRGRFDLSDAPDLQSD